MSSSVFPILPGMAWGVIKRPRFSTIVQKTASGREIRSALMSYPLWEFSLSFEVLRGSNGYTEMQTLAGFFNQLLGSYDTFLFNDPTDNSVTAQPFGTGDGLTTDFQLLRTMGGFIEPVQNVNGTPSIYVNGTLQTSGYTVGSTGIVTFTTAPASGVALTWTGNFYFRCRFTQDIAEFDQFMQAMWSLKKLAFTSVKQ